MDQCRECHKPIHWDDDACPNCGIESPHYREDQSPPIVGEGPDPFRNPIFRLVFPKYQRLGLFMMAVTTILVACTTPELHEWFWETETEVLMIVIAPFVVGLLYSVFHGVTTGKISTEDRQVMLFFAIVANLAACTTAAIYSLADAAGFMLIFPVWNLVNCVLLASLFFSTFDNSRLYREAIVDRGVNRFVIGLSYAFILAVFFLCYKVLNLHWAFTYSICITCATNFSGIVDCLISRPARDVS